MNAPMTAYKQDDPTTLDWWTRALEGKRADINPNEPMTGYYRARSKNKQTGEETLFAVAYWWHGGKCFCKVNPPGAIGVQPTLTGERHERMMTAWPHVAKEPIKYDVYQSVVAGKPWPDQHVTETAAPAEASIQPLDAKPPAAGAAEPPAEEVKDTSPQAVLARDIAEAKRGVSRYVRQEPGKAVEYLIQSDDMAGAAQTLRARLLTLSKTAEKARIEANAPHQKAIKENGLIWSPLEDEATRMANWLRDGPMKQWELHKRQQAEAAAKATAAAQEGQGALNTVPVQVASNAPAPAARIKGATGKAASVTEIKKAIIVDQDAVYRHFREDIQLKAILQGLANGAVRAGITVPGTTEEKDVKIS